MKSRKRKDTAANSQVQKRLDSLLKKRGKLGQSQQEGGFIGAILAATAPLWLPLTIKGVKRYFIKMVKEFVLIERGEYNRFLKTILSAMCRLEMKLSEILHQERRCSLPIIY